VSERRGYADSSTLHFKLVKSSHLQKTRIRIKDELKFMNTNSPEKHACRGINRQAKPRNDETQLVNVIAIFKRNPESPALVCLM
jgi:hypothetical protein